MAPDGALPCATSPSALGEPPDCALGGPAHAVESSARRGRLAVATPDRIFAALLAGLRKAGVACETSTDLVGVQLAGVAKNAAVLAAGPALAAGRMPPAPRPAVSTPSASRSRRVGAEAESFVGLAGAGDLVATVLAAHSRNRRAGELLAAGHGPEDIQGELGQVPEALDLLPVLARAMGDAGVRAPATHELAALVEGRDRGQSNGSRATRRPAARSRAA